VKKRSFIPLIFVGLLLSSLLFSTVVSAAKSPGTVAQNSDVSQTMSEAFYKLMIWVGKHISESNAPLWVKWLWGTLVHGRVPDSTVLR